MNMTVHQRFPDIYHGLRGEAEQEMNEVTTGSKEILEKIELSL